MRWIAVQPRCDEPADAPALCQALGWAALQLTPRVLLQEEAVLLEVSGSERLFGGATALLRRLLQACHTVTPVAWAAGESLALALARLRLRPVHGRAALGWTADAMPLHTLSAAREHLPTLARLGCNTWAQLRALPRGGVVRRFGAPLLDALDAAYGAQPEHHAWLTVPEVFVLQLELQALVESAPALMFAAQRLLSALRAWLQARQCGVLALQWTWLLDDRRNTSVASVSAAGPPQGAKAPSGGSGHTQWASVGANTNEVLLIRTAEATRDMAHLARLTAEQLARHTLAAPAHSLRLQTVEVQALPTASASLLFEEQRHGDSLHQLVERLSARLGPQQVLCLEPQADHRPEHTQRLRAALGCIKLLTGRARPAAPEALADEGAARLYPTWLLRTPLRLAMRGERPLYQGPLQLLAGPQRLEVLGWPQGAQVLPTLRDYFIAQSPQAGLLWIYRERLPQALAQGSTPGWFLHGMYG